MISLKRTVVFLALCIATIASAQTALTLRGTTTSADGLLTLTLMSTNPSDTAGVNNTYVWTVTNNSATTLNRVALGSHWGDWCGGRCTPPGPTVIATGPACAVQTAATELPNDAHFGVWCVPLTGVTLAPGQSATGSVTLRPGAGGPPDYTVYTGLIDANGLLPSPVPLTINDVVAPSPTDIQIKGAASNGSPPVGSTYAYNFEVKNAGPWGTDGGLVVVDTLPAALTYVSSFVTEVSLSTGQIVTVPFCNAVGQTVMCALDELQNGGPSGQVTITINVAAAALPQQIVNTASVHTVFPQTDSNTANNSATVIVTTK